MKPFRVLSFVPALLLTTGILIAVCIIIYSYSGYSSNNESNGMLAAKR